MLDHRVIGRRRRALGLSLLELAEQTGLRYDDLERYENPGTCTIELREALILADALGLSVQQVCGQRAAAECGGDAAIIGALLTRLAKPTAVETLGHALNWTADRVLGALDGLGDLLARCGQRLQSFDGQHYAIIEDAASVQSDELRRARTHQLDSLSDVAVQLLYTATRGRTHDRYLLDLNEDERVALAELFDLDFVEITASTFEPTVEVSVEIGLGAGLADRVVAHENRPQ